MMHRPQSLGAYKNTWRSFVFIWLSYYLAWAAEPEHQKCCPVIITLLATMIGYPSNAIHCSNHPSQSINQSPSKELQGSVSFGIIWGKQSDSAARCVWLTSGSLSLSLSLTPPPFHPLICLRHHSLGTGRHSLHQAWVNISQVSVCICISLSPSSPHADMHAYTHTHTQLCAQLHKQTCPP